MTSAPVFMSGGHIYRRGCNARMTTVCCVVCRGGGKDIICTWLVTDPQSCVDILWMCNIFVSVDVNGMEFG